MNDIPLLPYDPRETGLRRWFGPLSAAVMEYLWRRNRYTSARFVHERMEYDKIVVYTTVLTTLSRLYDDDLIIGRKQPGTCEIGRAHV